MTQTTTLKKQSIDIFNDAVAYFSKMTKAEILAEGQAFGCKLIPYYSLKKTIAWTVALRYTFINEREAYDNLIANYDIDSHEYTATLKTGYVPETVSTSEWVGDISEALTELKEVAASDYGLNAQHVAYIADDTAKMKEIICYHDHEARRDDITDSDARATIAETLIANSVGQAIVPPYNDYHFWLNELQSIIPLVAANGTMASKKLSQYRKHGGTTLDKNGAPSKQDILVAVLQEIAAITGYLESFSSDKDAGLPVYTKRDNIPAMSAFVTSDLIIEAPINTKVSSNSVLIAHSGYQCKLSVKPSILTALKLHQSDIDQVVVPMVISYQSSGYSSLLWDTNVFDIEITGEKFSVVDEILNPVTRQANWCKKAFLVKRLITSSDTRIVQRVVDGSDVYDDRYCLPGTLRVSKKDICFIRCEQFPEWQSSRSIEISRNGGEHWVNVFSWLGYEVQQQKGNEVRYHSLEYEARK